MKSTVEPLEGNKVKLSVEVDEAEFEQGGRRRLPQDRPGGAPPGLPARQGAPQGARGPARPAAGREQALQDALPEYYAAAVSEHDVDVIAAPEIDITGGQEAGDVAFDAVVEVRPPIEVAGYGGLRVAIERPERRRRGDRRADRPDARPVRQHARGRRPARAGRRQRHDRHRRHARRRGAARASPPTTTSTRSARAPSRPSSTSSCVGAEAGDILEFDAAHPDPDEERELHFEVARQGGEGEGAARASPTSGRPRPPSSRPSTSCGPSLADRMTRRAQGAGPDGAPREGRRGARRARRRRGARAAGRPGDAGAPAGPRHAPAGPGHAARAVPRR